MARVYVIESGNHNYSAVLTRISARQEGLCHFCGERIKENETIVSKSHSRRPKYFHQKCAERIHLM